MPPVATSITPDARHQKTRITCTCTRAQTHLFTILHAMSLIESRCSETPRTPDPHQRATITRSSDASIS